MLYEQIRHAHTVRGMYRMRHMLAQRKRHDMGTRLNYPKYSKQFYRIKSKLREECIISNRGTFIESLPNLHVAMMPLRVNGEQINVLGSRIPYVIFLALIMGPPRNAGYLARKCSFSRKAVYDALRRMEDAGLIRMDGFTATADDGPARAWLAGYLNAVKAWIDAREDAFVLFNTIPSYVGGPHARRVLDYEPGNTMGSAEMHIFTYEPFLDLIKSIVRESLYFKRHPKPVVVKVAHDRHARWVDGIPYQKDIRMAEG